MIRRLAGAVLAFGCLTSSLAAQVTYGVATVQADQACATYHLCGAGRVGVIDVGFGPASSLRIAAGVNYGSFGTGDTTHWQDDNAPFGGHGTHSASVLQQVAPLADLYVCRTADQYVPASSLGSIQVCLNWMRSQHVEAVNISLFGGAVHVLDAAVQAAHDAGIVVIVAAGNGQPIQTPADAPGAIAVAACDQSNHLAGFSNSGPPVAICCPGVGIIGAMPGGDFATMDGTSEAAPVCAGVVKVLRPITDAGPDSVKRLLCIGAVPVANAGCGVPQLMTIIAAMITAGAPTTPAVTPAPCAIGTTCAGDLVIGGTQDFLPISDTPWMTAARTGTTRSVHWSATPPAGSSGVTPVITLRSVASAAMVVPTPPPSQPLTRSCSSCPALTPGYHARTFTVADPTTGGTTTFAYQLYIPQGYTNSGTPWPVILSNHGSGERGSDNNHQLGVGLGAHLAAVGERAVIVFPQMPVTSGGGLPVFQLLYNVEKGALDEALTVVNGDPTRLYLTGNSAGAIRGWKQVFEQPTRFAAFFPASGEVYGQEILGSTTATMAQGDSAVFARLQSLPIHVYHGAKDGTVQVQEDRNLAALFASVPTFTYTEYPNAGHGDTWDTAFADPALWTWLFAQRRAIP